MQVKEILSNHEKQLVTVQHKITENFQNKQKENLLKKKLPNSVKHSKKTFWLSSFKHCQPQSNTVELIILIQ